MIKKRSIRVAFSLFLLLCFSAVAIPVDLFHCHEEEVISCSDFGTDGSCSHKVHLSKKTSYCFACLVHFEKNYVQNLYARYSFTSTACCFYIKDVVTTVAAERILTLLRGPPAFTIL